MLSDDLDIRSDKVEELEGEISHLREYVITVEDRLYDLKKEVMEMYGMLGKCECFNCASVSSW